jgi:mannose-6-phosphate isomerase-like protein (cupin superfamily)
MGHEKLPGYARDERPWGHFERFTQNEPSTVKIICVKAGEEFSLQTHAKRDEFWRILSGSGMVIVGSESHTANTGDEFYISRGTAHRAHADSELWFLEIALGEFDEDDIVRLEDKYGRA